MDGTPSHDQLGSIFAVLDRSNFSAASEAFDRIVDFLESFEELDDPQQRAKVLYPLDEVLLLGPAGRHRVRLYRFAFGSDAVKLRPTTTFPL